MAEVKHVAFNPSPMFAGIEKICQEQEREGWALVRVVYWQTYEAIAVFERALPTGRSEP